MGSRKFSKIISGRTVSIHIVDSMSARYLGKLKWGRFSGSFRRTLVDTEEQVSCMLDAALLMLDMVDSFKWRSRAVERRV